VNVAPSPSGAIVATAGSTDPSAPLVVLLHGRGSDETGIVGLASSLPEGAAYAAPRGPVDLGGAFTWFENRGIGRPLPDSLRATMDWFRSWLDAVAPAERPVVLVGFSGGAAFAGGLLLDDPARFTGTAILYGTLPFDAGLDLGPGALAGAPVLVAHGDSDTMIPRELLDRTWSYLHDESGAVLTAHHDAGGHAISAQTLAVLQGWLGDLLA
jgi:phospholipase/carboxylesterase